MENETHKILRFEIKQITQYRPDEKTKWLSSQKKRTCQIVDFAAQADHRVELKSSEKKDKYIDLARERKM